MLAKERGAVSIFIVLFTSLLVVVVTTSFVQIMLRNQQQASNNDLSQSAYDSAMAGVEDAKRALVRLKECGDTVSPECDNLRAALVNNINPKDCDVLAAAGATFTNNEVTVGAPALNQAYTCVTVQVKTPSYEGELKDQLPNVIPLISDVDSNEITHVRISWLIDGNIDGSAVAVPLGQDLPAYGSWPANMPPIMRAQLIQFNGNAPINLDNFSNTGNQNATTLFLYPSIASESLNFTNDGRRTPGAGNQPRQVRCEPDFDDVIYACSTTIALPTMPPGTQREAYLQLAAIYNKAPTNYKVELCRSLACPPENIINFDNVQPIVDSTGRASDLFRRVRARVSVTPSGTQQQFPEAALLVDGNVCKDFQITNNAGEYVSTTDGITCEP